MIKISKLQTLLSIIRLQCVNLFDFSHELCYIGGISDDINNYLLNLKYFRGY
jgi:hypothetical protein